MIGILMLVPKVHMMKRRLDGGPGSGPQSGGGLKKVDDPRRKGGERRGKIRESNKREKQRAGRRAPDIAAGSALRRAGGKTDASGASPSVKQQQTSLKKKASKPDDKDPQKLLETEDALHGSDHQPNKAKRNKGQKPGDTEQEEEEAGSKLFKKSLEGEKTSHTV